MKKTIIALAFLPAVLVLSGCCGFNTGCCTYSSGCCDVARPYPTSNCCGTNNGW